MTEPIEITRSTRSCRITNPVFCVSAVLFAGFLMLASNLFVSLNAVPVLRSLFGQSFPVTELQWMLTEGALYILLQLPPILFLLCLFRKSPLSPFRGKIGTPALPFLFIPMAIGSLYLLNMVIAMVAGDLFDPFDPPITADSLPHTPVGILLYFTNTCLLPAIFEEALFRGIMLKNLLPAIGKWPAIVVSALVFGLMHLNPAQSIFAFGFGILIGYAYVSSGSIWFGALIHMLNNAISCVATYWTYVYDLEWVQLVLSIFTLVCMAFGTIALGIYTAYLRRNGRLHRKTPAERQLPTGSKLAKIILCNPLLYVLFAGYAFLLWLFYLAV